MNSNDSHVFSVKELSDILKGCFENPLFSSLTIYGEVYSIKLGKFSYIEIGDQGNKQTSSPILKCAFSCYYGNDYGLEEIKVGDVIQVKGSLTYYPHGCSLTLWGKEVQVLQSQLGKNLLAKRKTLEKLEKLGYLDPKRKKPIPRYVKKVAILTASTGAAYQDILKTLHDRFPMDSVLFPIVAQGSEASKTIVEQMTRVQKSDCDVIILGRGGGSKTDLSCFDDEKVALAIAESRIPVITCIGHTIDTAIADRVSDVMAITPTEGASLINPSLSDTKENLHNFKDNLAKAMLNRIREKQMEEESFRQRIESLSPQRRIQEEFHRIELWKEKLNGAMEKHIQQSRIALNNEKSKLLHLMSSHIEKAKEKKLSFLTLLNAYNPQVLKEKGYAIIYKNDKKVMNSSQLKKGDEIIISYPDGRKEAKII